MQVEVHPASWEKWGNAAGPIRNAAMLEKGKPQLALLAPGGAGTAGVPTIGLKADGTSEMLVVLDAVAEPSSDGASGA